MGGDVDWDDSTVVAMMHAYRAGYRDRSVVLVRDQWWPVRETRAEGDVNTGTLAEESFRTTVVVVE